jgi:hypothetical protein
MGRSGHFSKRHWNWARRCGRASRYRRGLTNGLAGDEKDDPTRSVGPPSCIFL